MAIHFLIQYNNNTIQLQIIERKSERERESERESEVVCGDVRERIERTKERKEGIVEGIVWMLYINIKKYNSCRL